MTIDPLITALIPHRPPFLWIDRIISYEEGTMVTEKTIPEDLDIFKGHYPEHPILPGVILCEALFQTGALLIARMMQDDSRETQTRHPCPHPDWRGPFQTSCGAGQHHPDAGAPEGKSCRFLVHERNPARQRKNRRSG